MALKIFITGSSDGIGQAAAKILVQEGHQVTLHARSAERAKETQAAVPNAKAVLIADISTIAGAKDLAEQANAVGPWDSIIHNAGIMRNPGGKTVDGIAPTFAVNSLAPYILTALMAKPKHLLYLSSSMHYSGDGSLHEVTWTERKAFQDTQAYSDSKLHDVMLANAVARAWPDVQSCSLDPGWVKTKMGGGGAPGTTVAPAKAIAEFAVGGGSLVGEKTGVYFNPYGAQTPHKAALDTAKQDQFMGICEKLSALTFPK